MSDYGKLAPVGSVSPIKMRKVQRREKDGKGGNRDWQDELEEQMKKGSDQEKEEQEKLDKEEDKKEDNESKDKESPPPPSKPIIVHGQLDIKA